MNQRPLATSPKRNYMPLMRADSIGEKSGSNISNEHKLLQPFGRTLSEVASYERSKRDKATPDYRIKIVVVGDGAAGKTCLLIAYTQGRFPEDYVPTIFENYVTKIEGPNDKVIELALWDTAGQEEYSRLRPLSYGDVNIVMVCYSADNRVSLDNAEELWFPEVRHFCPSAPIMLIGLKSDLYAMDDLDRLVDPKEAEMVAQRMGAFVHLQCSSKTRQNLSDVFNTAIHTALYDEFHEPKSKGRGVRLFKKKAESNSQNIQQHIKKHRKHKCIIL